MHNPSHPALLRTPGRYGFPIERILPGSVSDCITDVAVAEWLLVITTEGGLVNFGPGQARPGQARVVRSPTPF